MLPAFVGGLHDRLFAAGAGVVDEDVGAAKVLLHLPHQAIDVGSDGHVGGYGQRLHAKLGSDGAGRGGSPLAVAGAEHNVYALARQRACHGQADALARTRDDGSLVG